MFSIEKQWKFFCSLKILSYPVFVRKRLFTSLSIWPGIILVLSILADKINELIKELIEVCEDIPDLPSSYLNHIKKLNEDITLQTNEKYRANGIHKMLIEIENLINLINENGTQKILRILFCIEVITYQLLVSIIQISFLLLFFPVLGTYKSKSRTNQWYRKRLWRNTKSIIWFEEWQW